MNKNRSSSLWWWLCCCSKEDKWWLQIMINPKWTVSVSAQASKESPLRWKCEDSIYRVWRCSLQSGIKGTSRGHWGAQRLTTREAVTIPRLEEAGNGIVLEDSSESWNHREKPVYRSYSWGMEALPGPQHQTGENSGGGREKKPYLLPFPALGSPARASH